jgi:hypothetical protein
MHHTGPIFVVLIISARPKPEEASVYQFL